MHLRATETKPKAKSIVERAVILLDLSGNNREPLGGVPLISIFKRFRPHRAAHRARSKNSWLEEREGAVTARRGIPGGHPYTDSRRFSVVKIYVYAVFVVYAERGLPFETSIPQSLRGPIPVAADATATLQPLVVPRTTATLLHPPFSVRYCVPAGPRD